MLTHGNLLVQRQVLKDYWGWQQRRRADPRAADLPRARPVRRVARRAAHRQQDDLVRPASTRARGRRACPRPRCSWACRRCTCGCSREPALTREACARHAAVHLAARRRCCSRPSTSGSARTGLTILERYGMSETVMLTSNPLQPRTASAAAARSACPLPGVRLRVVDDEGGTPAPAPARSATSR